MPTFCKSTGRIRSRGDGVTTYRYPLGTAGWPSHPVLLALEEHLLDASAGVSSTQAALTLGGDHATRHNATIRLIASYLGDGPGIVLVCDGAFTNERVDPLDAGDWIEFDGSCGDLAVVQGDGQLFVVELAAAE